MDVAVNVVALKEVKPVIVGLIVKAIFAFPELPVADVTEIDEVFMKFKLALDIIKLLLANTCTVVDAISYAVFNAFGGHGGLLLS